MYIHKILLDRHLVLYIIRVRIVSYIMQYTITRRTCALVFYSFASQEAHQPSSGLQHTAGSYSTSVVRQSVILVASRGRRHRWLILPPTAVPQPDYPPGRVSPAAAPGDSGQIY